MRLINRILFIQGVALVIFTGTNPLSAQFTPLIEVQGEGIASPFEGQEVSITGKVTEFFGDSWYMQDDFGPWNGVYVVGPEVSIASNPPYWSAARQPEVGDVLEIQGTVVEADGNTEIIDAVLINFVDFWNATPMGVWLTADAFQDEQYEGTRVRIDNATILSAPDAEGYWTVSDGSGEVMCWGIDTDDPGNNEDPDGPTPGDVYQIYGAMHQIGEDYVLHVGDIDVLSLSVNEPRGKDEFQMYPNPASGVLWIGLRNSEISNEPCQLICRDIFGREALNQFSQDNQPFDVSGLSRGIYQVEWRSVKNGLRKEAEFSAKLLIH